jgi:hypothetical protein
MLFYILYYEPLLEMVGPFVKRELAIEFALTKERKRERPTLWLIKETHSPLPNPATIPLFRPDEIA